MAEERIQLTPEGFQTIQQELDDARASMERAKEEAGDIHNSPDDQNREEAAEFDIQTTKEWFEQRVRQLEFVLSRADVIEGDADPDRVNVGESVVVWDFQDNQERTFRILSSEEATATQHGVSADSPVGAALLGKRVGDVIDVATPEGSARYSVKRVE